MLARRMLGAALLLAATISPVALVGAQEVDVQLYECTTTTTTTIRTTQDAKGNIYTTTLIVISRVCVPI